jgi:hypothetical protein
VEENASDLLELVQRIYQDACARCTVDVSDLRDLMTIRSRVKDEGVSFLTITLPTFSQDFERCLAQGFVDSTAFRSFRKVGSIPAFLQGMISLVFDRETGRRLDEPESLYIDAAIVVDSVRQICRTFNKLQLDCTQSRVAEAIQSFVQTERDFENFLVSDELRHLFGVVADLLWAPSVSGIQLDTLRTTHGPGATAEGVSGNQKYSWQLWHERLEPYFPFLECGYSISAYGSKEFDSVSFIPPAEELPVKVTPVPKTLKGPRIIAIEPCCMQYAQQAIRRELYSRIESSAEAGGHVNFTDQGINQQKALMASLDGSLATVDLSEASDRVPLDLALAMFNSNPDLRDAIESCRSTHAKLPDGSIIGPLRKFASMGSALCFPVESMYFYTCCVVALLRIRNLPVTYRNCYAVSRDIYIYGDDIIIPADETVAVLDYLQKYNCKVNRHKTFWHGFFRESCGLDAYKGVNVTPIYIRQVRPKNRRQASNLISWVSTANSFYKKGYWNTCQYMFQCVEQVIGPLPYVSEDSSALGRISFLGYRSIERWNDKLHRFEIRAMAQEAVFRTDRLSGYAALQKSLLSLHAAYDSSLEFKRAEPYLARLFRAEEESSSLFLNKTGDPRGLEESALHGVAALKRRWVPA